MAYLTPRTLAALLLLAPTLQFAQSAPAPSREIPETSVKPAAMTPVDQAEADDATLELEEYEVTGTRIRTLGGEATAVPVFSIPQIELERRGVTRLADVRWAIPQLAAAVGFNDNMMNSGTSRAQTVSTSFNMRGIGGNSTLVLVDGRRVPHTGQEAPGGAGGREDFSIDGLPVSAIERIEILPQGAGAIYGSEAIAGVVNVILKKNYRGAELRVTYDNTFDSDVAQTTVSLTAGYRHRKLSTFVTLSYEDQNAMRNVDRWWTRTYDDRVWGGEGSSFLFSPSGGAGTLATAWFHYAFPGANLDGLNVHTVGIPAGSNGSTTANSGYTTSIPEPFDAAAYGYAIDAARRLSAVFKADYEFNPRATLYFEARASKFRNDFTGAPVALTTQLPVGYAGNPFNQPVYLQKVFFDLPRPRTISAQENQALVLGMRGHFLDAWRYDASASFARNIVSDDAFSGSSFNFGLLSSAMSGANPPILAYDSTAGANPNGAGVLEALMPFHDHEDTTDSTQYLVTADGPVWQGWAGAWQVALGAEAGEEKVKFWREMNVSTPSYVLTEPFSRRHTAAFAEINIPLLSEKQNLPLVHQLEVGGAIRATNYSDIGSATTPTYRALYRPVSWLALRASRSEGFKPVRLYDLQAPVTEFPTTIRSTNTTVDPARGNTLVPRTTYTYRSGGNSALHPEESVSRNAGIVIDIPGRWFKGLSFSADYYELSYNERSGGASLQTLLSFFPERIFRNPLTPADQSLGYTAGTIKTSAEGLGWDASNINLSGVTTKGWDFRASYNRSFSAGMLSVTAALTDPNVTYTQATPGSVPSSTFGHQPQRMSGSVFWAQDAWEAGVSVNYQKKYYTGSLTGTPYPAYLEFNPQVSYNFAQDSRFNEDNDVWWARALSGSKLTVTVINALNKEPDIINGLPRFAGDPRLRRYIVSLSKKF